MKKVALKTIGCRLNQYETEKIAGQMVKCGFERVPFKEPADLYIINTCTVTGRADASSRNIISRAVRSQPQPAVVVIGCYVDSDTEKVAALNGVDLVVHNRDKDKIVGILRENFPSLFNGQAGGKKVENFIDNFHEHNRSWIKIGDGCSQKCAYCVIPSVRGPLVNRPPEEIIREINALVDHGYHEVVLTGIHIGMYRHGRIKSPADLIEYILKNSGISRIRLSSIEPQEVDDELIRAMEAGGRRVCRHLHIPMQSGSDRILKMMHRPYNSEQYLEIVRRVKEKIDRIVIGADIIVGFPGESEEDFAASRRMADCGYIDYLHVFSYSDRPGTEASGLREKIRPDIIKERNAILRKISEKNHHKRLNEEIGRIACVISEFARDKQGRFWGISDNYLRTIVPEGHAGGKEIVLIKITAVENGYLTGHIA